MYCVQLGLQVRWSRYRRISSVAVLDLTFSTAFSTQQFKVQVAARIQRNVRPPVTFYVTKVERCLMSQS